jgi:transposase
VRGRIVADPFGAYEQLYLSVARRLGIETALVSPEQSKSLTKLVRLDTGKTDKKDAQAIHLAGTMGKTQRHRAP